MRWLLLYPVQTLDLEDSALVSFFHPLVANAGITICMTTKKHIDDVVDAETFRCALQLQTTKHSHIWILRLPMDTLMTND